MDRRRKRLETQQQHVERVSRSAGHSFFRPRDWSGILREHGGASRNRTGVQGFAVLCVTTPPSRHARRAKDPPRRALLITIFAGHFNHRNHPIQIKFRERCDGCPVADGSALRLVVGLPLGCQWDICLSIAFRGGGFYNSRRYRPASRPHRQGKRTGRPRYRKKVRRHGLRACTPKHDREPTADQ
jgi:hypothetical protein